MKSRFLHKTKIKVVEDNLKRLVPVSQVCAKYRISRTLFYRWKKRYETKDYFGNSRSSLERDGYYFGKISTDSHLMRLFLYRVWLHPEWSVSRILARNGFGEVSLLISKPVAYKVLASFHLGSRYHRRIWKETYTDFASAIEALETLHGKRARSLLTEEKRLQLLERISQGKACNVARICADNGISRTLYYRWRRQQVNGSSLGPKLASRPIVRARQASESQVQAVFELVRKHPEWGVGKIAEYLPVTDGVSVLGRHGVQRVLERAGLHTYEKRRAWLAREAQSAEVIEPRGEWLGRPKQVLEEFLPGTAPAPPPQLEVMGGDGVSVDGRRKWFGQRVVFFISLVTTVLLGQWVRMLVSAPSLGVGLGWLLASLALLIGMFFFAYSFKYYLTIAVVLSFSRRSAREEEEGGEHQGFLTKFFTSRPQLDRDMTEGSLPTRWTVKGTLAALFGVEVSGSPAPEPERAAGLDINLDDTVLKRYPFISVQIPLYNEKRVAERAIRACMEFDYPHFEILVLDDSTDETTTIVQQLAKQDQRIRVIHRPTRTGYKGGALAYAAERMDKRAELIAIFDADFVPYPDTLTQLVRYLVTANEPSGGLAPAFAGSMAGGRVAAVQGYQWHVLNKSENWITRGVRSEFSGSYVIERSGTEVYGGLKQIAGSVYLLRKDALEQVGGWGRSITEDFELTLKLYEAGYKVLYTPYVQTPSECVSTLKRLLRQRMRWAEGHSHNIKKMFWPILKSPHVTLAEKLEFAYLSPYYLQSFFFILGTVFWLLSESVFRVRLPFWTQVWGWSLVLTNMLSLPLMNLAGMFLEEAEEKDYLGILSFVALTYTIAPFQAYAAVKGFLEKDEGPWFRTPKTGKITDSFRRGSFYRWIAEIFPWKGNDLAASLGASWQAAGLPALAPTTTNHTSGRRRGQRWMGNMVLGILLSVATLFGSMAQFVPLVRPVSAQGSPFARLTNSQITDGEIVKSDLMEKNKEKLDVGRQEITEPLISRFEGRKGASLDYIFHKEPRVRLKAGSMEIETTLVEVAGLGQANSKKSVKDNGRYDYVEVVEDADLVYTPKAGEIKEELILKQYHDISDIVYNLQTVGLTPVKLNDDLAFFVQEQEDKWMFKFETPFMYEQGNVDETNGGVEYILEKQTVGWKLTKHLTDEGKAWLADPNRQFPVVIDPTTVNSVIQAAVTTTETNYGSPMRNIAFFPNATAGSCEAGSSAGCWYAVYADGGNIAVERCAAADGCDANGDWTSVTTDLDTTESDTDNESPSVFKSGDTLYVVWFDDTNTSGDGWQYNTVNTLTDALGTMCDGADLGTLADAISSIAVSGDGDVYIAMSEIGGTNDAEVVSESAAGCGTNTAITTGSGFDQNDRPEMLAFGTNVFLMFVSDIGLRASAYDDSVPGWDVDTDDIDVNGGTANNTTTDMSAVTDGTDVWVIQRNGTTGDSEQFKCTSCSITAANTWTSIADPWGAGTLTATSFVGLSYMSTPNKLVAAFLDDQSGATDDRVVFRTTDADTISWDSTTYTFSIGGQSIDIDDLSMTANVASDAQVAITFTDATTAGGEFEFSTLPENFWPVLLALPVWHYVTNRRRKRREQSRRGG